MKKLSILLFVLAFSIHTHAQFTLGIKGGYSHAWPEYGDMDLPEGAETDISGFNVGILLEHKIKSSFVISMSPGYVKRGAACLPGWQTDFVEDSKVYLNNFEIPLSVGKVFAVDRLKLDVVPSLGYGFSYLFSAYAHEDQTWSDQQTFTIVRPIDIGNDPSDRFNAFDHGMYISLRVHRSILPNHSIFMESSYYHGMKDFDKQNTSKTRNLNYNFGLAYDL